MSKAARSPKSNTRKILVLSPLLLLIVLVGVRWVAWHYFVMCDTGRCESLAQLEKIFVPEGPETLNADPNTLTAEQRLKKEIAASEIKAKRYGARLTWVFLGMVCVIVCVAAFAAGASVIFHSIPSQTLDGHLPWIVALVIAVGIWMVFWWSPNFTMPVIIGYLHSTFENTGNPGYAKGIAGVIGAINSLAYAAAIYVAIAMASILIGNEMTVSRDASSRARETPAGTLPAISSAMKRLQLMLYAGTIMLVVGVLLERALWQWAVAFTSRDDNAAKVAHSFVATITAVDGGFFTLALAAVYLPAAAILRRSAEQAKDLPADEKKKEEALQAHGLNFSFVESIPRLAAILAPLLAGPIGELFTRLGK